MDSKFFRLPTKPNFVGAVQSASPVDIRTRGGTAMAPAPDNRYPGWPAQMSDGRLVTDYRPHCEANIPAGRQFPTKAWMQTNAEGIMEESRRRMLIKLGAVYPFDSSVVPPPQAVVTCKPDGCSKDFTEAPGGIGVERGGTPAPYLFGTFQAESLFPVSAPPGKTMLTQRFEGGRNTLIRTPLEGRA